jgi:predicted aspartyl protease/Tfp pilus assembly protein PilF
MPTCHRAALIVLIALTAPASAQAQAAAQPSTKTTCAIDTRSPSEADDALYRQNYPEAERLYRAALAADPASVEAMAGIVRALIGQDKLPDALALATQFDAAHPNTPALLDALGEVRFRRGEVDEAAIVFNRSIHLDLCNGITHYDMYRFLNLNGMYATAQKRLDSAHTLAPNNQRIKQTWHASHQTPLTPQETLAVLQYRLQSPTLTADEKDGIQAAIAGIQTREKGDCQLVAPVTDAKVPMAPISFGAAVSSDDMYAAGLDVFINGKRKRLMIDTGASGLLLTRAVAKSAGLVPELQTKDTGIGDQGAAAAFVTHVDSIRIGQMEFKNCMVSVLAQNRAVLDNTDGLIGPDVFRNFVVTLDIPGRELRLGPLPPRPGDAAAQPTSLTTSATSTTSDDQGLPQTLADRARDRYVAPEMKDWTPVFRSAHFLIFPTIIGNAPLKLFIMDTGAAHDMISPAAAREVTHVSGDAYTRIQGLSGEVKDVLVADKVSITFGSVRKITQGMTSFDSSNIGRFAGIDISGTIGFSTLRDLVLSIDYRDNLVHVVYDPKHGFHTH